MYLFLVLYYSSWGHKMSDITFYLPKDTIFNLALLKKILDRHFSEKIGHELDVTECKVVFGDVFLKNFKDHFKEMKENINILDKDGSGFKCHLITNGKSYDITIYAANKEIDPNKVINIEELYDDVLTVNAGYYFALNSYFQSNVTQDFVRSIVNDTGQDIAVQEFSSKINQSENQMRIIPIVHWTPEFGMKYYKVVLDNDKNSRYIARLDSHAFKNLEIKIAQNGWSSLWVKKKIYDVSSYQAKHMVSIDDHDQYAQIADTQKKDMRKTHLQATFISYKSESEGVTIFFVKNQNYSKGYKPCLVSGRKIFEFSEFKNQAPSYLAENCLNFKTENKYKLTLLELSQLVVPANIDIYIRLEAPYQYKYNKVPVIGEIVKDQPLEFQLGFKAKSLEKIKNINLVKFLNTISLPYELNKSFFFDHKIQFIEFEIKKPGGSKDVSKFKLTSKQSSITASKVILHRDYYDENRRFNAEILPTKNNEFKGKIIAHAVLRNGYKKFLCEGMLEQLINTSQLARK